MSISDKFQEFYNNVLMSKTDIASISFRYRRITKKLNEVFRNLYSETSYSLYVGSYGRDTEVSTSDIDILYQLPFEKYRKYDAYVGNGQSALLQEVKNAILTTYPLTTLKGDGQIISISFSDGMTIELLPAFLNNDGSYTYPNSNNGGSWKVTNPKTEISAIKTMNDETNKNLKKLCRMFRLWKKTNNVDVPGVLIDTFAYRFIENYEYKDKSFMYFDWFTRDFLKHLSELDKEQSSWRIVGSSRLIYYKGNLQFKAKQSLNNALKAIEHENKEENWSANYEWRLIYGNKFPE